jgi:hypothetical protein
MKTLTLLAMVAGCSVLLRAAAFAADAHPASDSESVTVHQKETPPAAGKDVEKLPPVEDYSAEEELVHGKAQGIHPAGKGEKPLLRHTPAPGAKGLLGKKHSVMIPQLPLPSSSKPAYSSSGKSTLAVDSLRRQPSLANLGGAAKGTLGAAHQPTDSHAWHTVSLTPSAPAAAHGRTPGMASLGGPVKPKNQLVPTDLESKSKY